MNPTGYLPICQALLLRKLYGKNCRMGIHQILLFLQVLKLSLNNRYGLISWFMHGNIIGAVTMSGGDCGLPRWALSTKDNMNDGTWQEESGNSLDNMTNYSYPSILYTIGCWQTPFDVYSPWGHSGPTLGNGFTCMTKAGGPAFLGDTRNGFYFYSSYIFCGFLDYLNSGTTNLGAAELMSKYTHADHYLSYSHNLVGCPETKMWVTTPSTFTSASVTDNGSTLTVNAGTSGCDITVCSGNNGASYYLTAHGVTSYTFSTSVRPLYITVTKPNYVPYTAVTGGTFTTNESWFGNFKVLGSVTFNSGTQLTVLSGSKIKFNSGTSLTMNGKLVVEGTSSARVMMTSASGSTPGSWGTIYINGNGANNSSISYADISYGTLISVVNAAGVVIQNCNITDVTQGIYYSGSSNGSVIGNTLTSSTTYHGIRFENSSTGIACHQNKVKKTSGRSGVGVLFGGGSTGVAWQNDILGWNWGVGTIYGSSPNFWQNFAGPPYRNNRITDCNYGANIYASSWPIFGGPAQGSGFNSFSVNSYNIYLRSGPPSLYAYSNYWGVYPDPSGTFLLGSGSTILANSPLPPANDPWLGYPFPKAAGFPLAEFPTPAGSTQTNLLTTEEQGDPKVNAEDNMLFSGIKLRVEKGKKEAVDFFKAHIEKHPYNQAAYVELYNCVDNETIDDLLTYFSSLPGSAAKEHELLLAYLHLKKGNVGLAKKVNNNIIAKYPNTPLAVRAQLNNVYICLYNEDKLDDAVSLYTEAVNKPELSTSFELSLVQSAIEIYAQTHGKEKPSLPELPQSESEIPGEISMQQNFPNPFNPSTTISYQLPSEGFVCIKIYDMLGREVETLVNEFKTAGSHQIQFNASQLASGVYFYKLQSGGFNSIKKMLLLR